MLNTKDHYQIAERIALERKARIARHQRELEQIKPTISDALLGYALAAVCVVGILLILIYVKN